MRSRIIFLKLSFLSFAFILILGSNLLAQTTIYRNEPLRPLSPKSASDCNKLSQEWDNLINQVDQEHKDCLDRQSKAKAPRNPNSSYNEDGECTYGACQKLHNYRAVLKRKKNDEVDACRLDVLNFTKAERARLEAEEKQKREEEEKKRKAEEEQRKGEDEKREKERKEKEEKQQKNDKAKREAEEAERQARENAKRLEEASKQSQREREALAERTEMREQRKEQLKQRAQDADDRFRQSVDEQTQKARDQLLDDLIAKANPELSIFPDPSKNNPADDFDLSAINEPNFSNTSFSEIEGVKEVIRDSLSSVWSKIEEGLSDTTPKIAYQDIAPDNPIFSKVFNELKNEASSYVKEQLNERFQFEEIGKEITNTFKDTVKNTVGEDKYKIFENLASKPDESNHGLGRLGKKFFDNTVGKSADSVADGLNRTVDDALLPSFKRYIPKDKFDLVRPVKDSVKKATYTTVQTIKLFEPVREVSKSAISSLKDLSVLHLYTNISDKAIEVYNNRRGGDWLDKAAGLPTFAIKVAQGGIFGVRDYVAGIEKELWEKWNLYFERKPDE